MILILVFKNIINPSNVISASTVSY